MTHDELIHWHLSKNEPDSWFVSINGNTLPEKHNLKEIKEISDSSQDLSIQVLHELYGDDDEASWTTYEKPEDDSLAELKLIRQDIEEGRKRLAKINDNLVGVRFALFGIGLLMLLALIGVFAF